MPAITALTNGPATATAAIALFVMFCPCHDTYAGTKKMNELPIKRSIIPINNQMYAALNVAEKPIDKAMNLWPNSWSIIAGAVTQIANLNASISKP